MANIHITLTQAQSRQKQKNLTQHLLCQILLFDSITLRSYSEKRLNLSHHSFVLLFKHLQRNRFA
ncbi:hypothetical protein FZC70_05870 [Bacillus subtilis]|nr:hypothetical protein FZC70_05870 [Bacillus subtilis]